MDLLLFQARRWWTYQQERFPLKAHGPLVILFAFAALSFASRLRGAGMPSLLLVGAASLSLLCFFLLLRIADEFKDFAEDATYRPYRAVPRGLVSLPELGVLALLIVAGQVVLAEAVEPRLFGLLAVVVGYVALMTVEFGVGGWLRRHLGWYLLSHMGILPLLACYAAAFAGAVPVGAMAAFLVASYATGLVIEVGRKLRAPVGEEPGVETYTAAWGTRRAPAVWLGAMTLAGLAAVIAAAQVGAFSFVTALLAVVWSSAAIAAWRFARQPTPPRAQALDLLSAGWTLALYLGLGFGPLV